MIRAWRIVATRFADSAMTGEGARLYGGQWNTPGHAVVYLADCLPLAALEILAGLKNDRLLNRAYSYMSVDIPETLIEQVPLESLPKDWRRPNHPTLPRIGDMWIDVTLSLALQTPNALIPGHWNYLLNPGHSDWSRVILGEIRPFAFDERLRR